MLTRSELERLATQGFWAGVRDGVGIMLWGIGLRLLSPVAIVIVARKMAELIDEEERRREDSEDWAAREAVSRLTIHGRD